MRVRVGVQWAQLDGSHAASQPVPNEHFVELQWMRVVVGVNLPLGDGWDLELEAPYDVKDVEARYELPDGTPFDNPLGDLHHRTERLEGFSDFLLMASHRPRDVLLPGDFVRIGLGISLPVGRTEEDPYALGLLGIKHQHIQFGSGTVYPAARLDYAWQPDRIGFDLSLGARLPFYENADGYLGAGLLEFAAGPRMRLGDGIHASLHYVAAYQTRATWDGLSDPNTGYVQHAIALAVPVSLGHGVTLIPSVIRTLDINTRGGGDSYEMDWSASVGFDVAMETAKIEK